jgi:serine/threonine protein kinase/ABC-type branched-subunit amino acid transport system substrate-binding protein
MSTSSSGPRRLGKYELRERLGRGGMGEIWKAFDTQLQRYVAIKFLHADLQNDPSFVSRFEREAQVIASLHHPNIVKIYDFQISQPPESENTTAYMVMDYVEGQTLASYIRSTSRVGKFPSAADLLHLFTPISAAIDYAHQRSMIHRDIKPSNILLDKRSTSRNPIGEPILTDFGIAKLLGTAANTQSGWWFGTPIYTSPEQARGLPGDERSDLYSLGVILYEVCTGVLPFQGNNPATILMQHINAMPTSPALINPTIPPALTVVILRSIAKDPAARFPSAASMVAALAEALNLPVPEGLSQPVYPVDPISGSSYQSPVSPHLPLGAVPPVSVLPTQVGTPWTQSVQNTPSNPSFPGQIKERSRYFMVQQYVEGENLQERMDRLNQPMEEQEVLIYASQVLESLDDLGRHTPPQVHGNIKPENIMISAKDKRAYLVDSGFVIADMANNVQRKQTPAQGTPGYAPLEQLQGDVDPRSDLYALAATMHYLLTNRDPSNHPPFVYPPVRTLNQRVSPEVESVLLRALANDITQRYQSALAMKRDIDYTLLRRYGISSDTALGLSGSIAAVGALAASPATKTPKGLRERLHLPGAASTSPGTNQPLSAQPQLPAQPPPVSPAPGAWQRRPGDKRVRNMLLALLVLILLLAGALSFTLLSHRNDHPTTPTTAASATGIGVSRAPDGEYIGISDGTYAFDTNRADGNLKRQATDKLKGGDSGSAQTLLASAVAADTNDAEALIYLEDLRVLASGRPYITLVVGTMIGEGLPGRGDLQGAYVAQKEYNDGFKLPGGTQVRLLIANSGNDKTYARTVAQQIVRAAQADKTIVGVMGWPYSSRVLNAVNVLAAAHIPMVAQTASSGLLTGISPYFFRVVPPDASQALAGAKYVEQTLHAKAAALFVDPTEAYSKSLADAFRHQFTADGNQIVATEQYTEGKPETLPALLQDALSHNPDLIYFSGFSNDVSVLVTNLPSTGPFANLLVMGGDGLYLLGGYSSSAHANFGRLRFTAFAFPDEWDVLRLTAQKPAFFREYSEYFNPSGQVHPNTYGYTRPDSEVMLSFDATMALLEGSRIALAGAKMSITPTDLRQALATVTGARAIQGVGGQIAFGPDGNPIGKAVVVLGVVGGGFIQIETVQGNFLKGS